MCDCESGDGCFSGGGDTDVSADIGGRCCCDTRLGEHCVVASKSKVDGGRSGGQGDGLLLV